MSRQAQTHKNPDVKLSKSLSYVLRHGPKSEGLPLMAGGFLFVDDILRQQQFQRYTEDDVQRVVTNNDKQRFLLEVDTASQRLKIRANQGHTVDVPDLDVTEVTNADEIPTVVHGTSVKAWQSIEAQGLSRMKRNHIHFAPGEPGEAQVISGMRASCDVVIYINARRALADGLQFFRSANNVILCPGDSSGVLLPKYFDAVYRCKPVREKLL